MKPIVLERVRTSLLERQVGLDEWLRTTSAHKKEVLLGSSTEQAVHAHLDTIKRSIGEVESDVLGRCEVCRDYVDSDLLEIDYAACVCIDHLSDEEVRNLELDLELAQRVQKTLLPQEPPNIPGMNIAAYSRPAHILGGDYFDFVECGVDTYCLAIADVTGHGIAASLHMASIQAMLRSVVPTSRSPTEVVKRIHKLFIHNMHFVTFVTLFIGIFDSITRTFSYCNAGHNPPIVLQQNAVGRASIVWLDPTGAAIGLVEESEYAQRTLSLHEGDLLVMYTDGVTEAANPQGEMFGSERLAGVVERMYQSPPREVVSGIREDLEGHTDGRPLADDATVIVGRIT